jgi:AcrR family transcriptional regulator
MAFDQTTLQQGGVRRPRKRASEIVDAAARVFALRGYHGTSTQDIADALGLKQASLYYYFPSKEAALERVCEHGVEGFVEAAEAILRRPGTPREKIERLIASHLTPLETRRDYVRVFINERRYLPAASRKRIGRASRRLERIFQQVIETGIGDGSIRQDADPRLSTLAILGICNAVINWRPTEPNTSAKGLAREFSRLVLAGLSAPGKARPAAGKRKRAKGRASLG